MNRMPAVIVHPKPLKEDALKRRLRRMVRYVKEQQETADTDLPGFQYFIDKKQSSSFRFLWTTVFLCYALICVYQIGERIVYYRTYPVAVNVLLDERNRIEIPGVFVCFLQTENLYKLSLKYKKELDAEKEAQMKACVGLLDFTMLSKVRNLTIEEIWKNSDPKQQIVAFDAFEDKKSVETIKLDETDSPMGKCVIGNSEIHLKYRGMKNYGWISVKNLPRGACERSSIVFSYQDKGAMYDPRTTWLFSFGLRRELFFGVSEFRILDTPTNPCVSGTDYSKCMEKCTRALYSKISPDCRFPFMNDKKKMCTTGNETWMNLLDILYFSSRQDPYEDCKCIRKCFRRITDICQITLNENEPVSDFYVYYRSNRIEIYEEYLAYELIGLFCDIGGNLGLYLGLSVLSLFDIIHVLWQLRNKHSRKLFRDNDPLFKKVKKIMNAMEDESTLSSTETNTYNIPGLDHIVNQQFGIGKILWFIIVATCNLLCFYSVCERIQYFFSYPTSVAVVIEEERFMEFPDIIVCGESKEIVEYKRYYPYYFNDTKLCDVDLLDLMRFDGFTPENLWEYSSIEGEFIYWKHPLVQKSVYQNVEKKSYDTIDGRCTRFNIGKQRYAGPSSYYYTSNIAIYFMCDRKYRKVYVIPPGEMFDITSYRYVPMASRVVLMFEMKKVKRLNTPVNPCSSNEEADKCKADCSFKKLRKKITCKLPFLEEFDWLEPCNTTAMAKATRSTYVQIHSETNAHEECGCLVKCKETIISSRLLEEPLKSPMSFVAYMYQDNIVLNIVYFRAYTFIKLLCDIGGNLGLGLGMSFLSMSDSFQLIVRACWGKSCRKKE